MGLVYLAVAWLVLQVVATVAPILELPGVFEKAVLLLLVVGFPVALVIAWAYELTPDGVRPDTGDAKPAAQGRRPIDYVIVATLGIALAYFVADKYFWSVPDEAAALESSVAVLPFTNLTQDESNDPFTMGIHDDLLTHLSRIASLKTTSRTSVLQYEDTTKTIPEIAAELGVATVLEAGVQRVGDRVRINAQLIDAASDVHLWAEQYDRELTAVNVFEIQSEIATAIADALQAALTSDEEERLRRIPTRSIDALDRYFIGRQLLEQRTLVSIEAALQYFRQVTELDANFALGWSGLADAYMLLPEYLSTFDRDYVERQARSAINKALDLNPDLPEVRASQAWYELRFYKWDEAEAIFRAALEVYPDNINVLHWMSHVLAFRGHFDEALVHAQYALKLEPDSSMMRTNLAYILVDGGRFDEALQLARQTLRMDPTHIVQIHNLFLHELRAGLPESAAATYVAHVYATGGNPAAATQIGEMFIAYAERGEVGVVTADLIDGARLGNEDLAQVLAAVGDSEGTIAALRATIPEHAGSRSVFSMKINPLYDFIRDDPRFQAMLAEVGLAE